MVLFTAYRSNILAAIVPGIAVFMVSVFFATFLNLAFARAAISRLHTTANIFSTGKRWRVSPKD
jgi:hypothetical protein